MRTKFLILSKYQKYANTFYGLITRKIYLFSKACTKYTHLKTQLTVVTMQMYCTVVLLRLLCNFSHTTNNFDQPCCLAMFSLLFYVIVLQSLLFYCHAQNINLPCTASSYYATHIRTYGNIHKLNSQVHRYIIINIIIFDIWRQK